MYENYPLVPYGETMRIFYLSCFGYHILKTVEQLLAKVKRSDHIEMMLHHGCTVMLVAGSYLINAVEIGVIIMYAHDISDVFGHFCKAASDTHFTTLKNFNAASLWFGWLYSRLIVFPWITYYGVLVVPYNKPTAPIYIGSYEETI